MFVDSMDCFLTYNLSCVNNTFTQLNSSSSLVLGDPVDSSFLNGGDRSNVDLTSSNQQSSILVSVQHCVITALILGAIILSTITGNILVIAAVKLEKSLHSVAYYLFVSLAVADLMVASMVMPIAVLKEVTRSWVLGSLICDAWVMIDLLCCTASILHLVAIALDRYWAITNLDYATKRTAGRILLLISVIWVTSILIASSHLFPVFRDKRGRPSDQCHLIGNVPYTILSTVGAFYIPLIGMCIIYWKIFQAAKFRIRRKAFNTSRSPPAAQPLLTGTVVVASNSAFADHQHDVVPCSPATPSDHQSSSKKHKKYQPFSPTGFRRNAQKHSQSSSNHQSHRKDADPDNNSLFSTNHNQHTNDYQLKPLKKTSYSLLKKQKGTFVTVTRPVVQLSTTNRFKTAYNDNQHEFQPIPPAGHSLNNNDLPTPIHTVSNPILNSVPSSPNTSYTVDTPSFKPIPSDTIVAETNNIHFHQNNTIVVSRSPAIVLRKKIDIKRERKATKVLGVVMGCFILCWLPFFLEETICGIFHLTINEKIISVLTWLGYLNSLLNPVIYTIFSPDFRQAFGKILFGKYRKRRRRLKK